VRGRIVIPIRNPRGQPVAYAGRALDGGAPKYKLPARFHKALELFNLQRAAATGARTVIVVQDYLSCKVPNQYHCEYDDHESNYCSYVVD
jgi:hypothetical protein